MKFPLLDALNLAPKMILMDRIGVPALALTPSVLVPPASPPPMTLASLREDVRLWRREHPEHAPAHYHACPCCYEHEACTLDCAIEPDLGEHKGCPFGDHAVCTTCIKAGVDES